MRYVRYCPISYRCLCASPPVIGPTADSLPSILGNYVGTPLHPVTPLDGMLNQFKVKTQFIVITHNPRTTTEAADAVYGVTMQEPGVSSVVSVRMKGAQVDAEEPAAA